MGIIETFDSKISEVSSSIYYFVIGIIYFTYFVSILGIVYINPSYTKYLNTFIRIFVAFVLLIRFNPWRKITYVANDRILIMASAVFILINEGVTVIIRQYFQDLVQI